MALEFKVTGGRLKKHQPVALRSVIKNEFSYKIPDLGRRNPFDAIILKNADAYIVIADGRNCKAYTPDMEWVFDFIV